MTLLPMQCILLLPMRCLQVICLQGPVVAVGMTLGHTLVAQLPSISMAAAAAAAEGGGQPGTAEGQGAGGLVGGTGTGRGAGSQSAEGVGGAGAGGLAGGFGGGRGSVSQAAGGPGVGAGRGSHGQGRVEPTSSLVVLGEAKSEAEAVTALGFSTVAGKYPVPICGMKG